MAWTEALQTNRLGSTLRQVHLLRHHSPDLARIRSLGETEPASGYRIPLLDDLLKPVRCWVRFPASRVEDEESERTPMFITFPKFLEQLLRTSCISGAIERSCQAAHASGVPRRKRICSLRVFDSLRESPTASNQDAQQAISQKEVLINLQNLAKFGLRFSESPSHGQQRPQDQSKFHIEWILVQRPLLLFQCLDSLAGRQQVKQRVPSENLRRNGLASQGQPESLFRSLPVVLVYARHHPHHGIRFRQGRIDIQRSSRGFARQRHELVRRPA